MVTDYVESSDFPDTHITFTWDEGVIDIQEIIMCQVSVCKPLFDALLKRHGDDFKKEIEEYSEFVKECSIDEGLI